MASILKNLAPPFDSGKTYKYGDRFVTGGHMYQVLEPFSGELDMNKLVEVTIADLVKGGYPPYDSFAGELVEAASVTSDEQNTYFGVSKPGFYNEESKIFTPNSNLGGRLDSITGLSNVLSTQSNTGNQFTIMFENAVVGDYYRIVIGSNDDCTLSITNGFNTILNNDVKTLRGNRVYVLIVKATSTTISAKITTSHTSSINSGSIDHINFN